MMQLLKAIKLRLINSLLQGKIKVINRCSGYSKNQSSVGGSIIAHDIVEVKQRSNLANNGNQIFNSGGYSSSSA